MSLRRNHSSASVCDGLDNGGASTTIPSTPVTLKDWEWCYINSQYYLGDNPTPNYRNKKINVHVNNLYKQLLTNRYREEDLFNRCSIQIQTHNLFTWEPIPQKNRIMLPVSVLQTVREGVNIETVKQKVINQYASTRGGAFEENGVKESATSISLKDCLDWWTSLKNNCTDIVNDPLHQTLFVEQPDLLNLLTQNIKRVSKTVTSLKRLATLLASMDKKPAEEANPRCPTPPAEEAPQRSSTPPIAIPRPNHVRDSASHQQNAYFRHILHHTSLHTCKK